MYTDIYSLNKGKDTPHMRNSEYPLVTCAEGKNSVHSIDSNVSVALFRRTGRDVFKIVICLLLQINGFNFLPFPCHPPPFPPPPLPLPKRFQDRSVVWKIDGVHELGIKIQWSWEAELEKLCNEKDRIVHLYMNVNVKETEVYTPHMHKNIQQFSYRGYNNKVSFLSYVELTTGKHWFFQKLFRGRKEKFSNKLILFF